MQHSITAMKVTRSGIFQSYQKDRITVIFSIFSKRKYRSHNKKVLSPKYFLLYVLIQRFFPPSKSHVPLICRHQFAMHASLKILKCRSSSMCAAIRRLTYRKICQVQTYFIVLLSLSGLYLQPMICQFESFTEMVFSFKAKGKPKHAGESVRDQQLKLFFQTIGVCCCTEILSQQISASMYRDHRLSICIYD